MRYCCEVFGCVHAVHQKACSCRGDTTTCNAFCGRAVRWGGCVSDVPEANLHSLGCHADASHVCAMQCRCSNSEDVWVCDRCIKGTNIETIKAKSIAWPVCLDSHAFTMFPTTPTGMERNYVVSPGGSGLQQVLDHSTGTAQENGAAAEEDGKEDREDHEDSVVSVPENGMPSRPRKRKAALDADVCTGVDSGISDDATRPMNHNGESALRQRRRRPFEEVLLDLLSKRAKEGKITKRTWWHSRTLS